MKQFYKDYLFTKNILVNDSKEQSLNDETFSALFTIAKKYNIRINKGKELANLDILKYIESQIPNQVTEAFYRGFPETVKKLTPKELLFDQLLHYFDTYVEGNFEGDAAHSLFEETFEKIAFKETTTIKDFDIVTEEEALNLIQDYVSDLCLSTRPLSQGAYDLVKEALNDGCVVESIASRDTAIKLMLDLNNPKLQRYLNLSDVLKVVEEILHNNYSNTKMTLKKLNLKNKDRKFISSMLDHARYTDFQKSICFERRADWKGLLHHIHYVPKNEYSKNFVNDIRNSEKNLSAMSDFESFISSGNIIDAVNALAKKGNGAILRNLNYILSRCKKEDIPEIIKHINSDNPIILLQLISQYKNYIDNKNPRTFTFTNHYKLKTHRETNQEVFNRKSFVDKEIRTVVVESLWDNIKNIYKNKFNKVYISENMKQLAVPMQETTAETGYGILPKGTRIHIPENKIVRAFTYWEKVNDIDLSCIGVTSDGSQVEFSWRTMFTNQTQAICFSGDQTRGYKGGSEYLDFDIKEIKKLYPTIKYLIVCDNVFTSAATFNECFCKAGYMLRDRLGSGEIWEPKTVESSYKITGDSSFNYLFAIDVENNDFVWLNMCKNSIAKVSGDTDATFITKYINMTEIINMYSLFEMMATEIVTSTEDADVIVSDDNIELKENQIQIKSTDTEKILKYLNNN